MADRTSPPKTHTTPPPPEEASAGWLEPESSNDADSSYDSSDAASTAYTESLRSSLLQSVQENGRGYHRYRDGHYFIPDDDQEQERLDMQHEMFLITMDRRLYYAPLTTVTNALDIGTGTGIWAIHFADDHPESNIIGTDLSAIQPSFVPPNCKFEIDDFEAEWTFPQKFDFIHGRMLAGSIAKPARLFEQVYAALEPGGWFELQDFAFPVRSDDGTMVGTPFEHYNQLLVDGLKALGRDGGWASEYDKFMADAGFTNIVRVDSKWPQNPWPKDPHYKRLGQWNMVNTLEGLHGFGARLCIQVLGMGNDEFEVLLAKCRKDIRNTKIHAYWPM